jgi:hypothetical protein
MIKSQMQNSARRPSFENSDFELISNLEFFAAHDLKGGFWNFSFEHYENKKDRIRRHSGDRYEPGAGFL